MTDDSSLFGCVQRAYCAWRTIGPPVNRVHRHRLPPFVHRAGSCIDSHLSSAAATNAAHERRARRTQLVRVRLINGGDAAHPASAPRFREGQGSGRPRDGTEFNRGRPSASRGTGAFNSRGIELSCSGDGWQMSHSAGCAVRCQQFPPCVREDREDWLGRRGHTGQDRRRAIYGWS